MAENPTLQIPRDVIEPIIQAHVSAAITQALGERDLLVKTALDRVIMRPVTENGNAPQYSSDKTKPWLEWAVGALIQKAILSALQEELDKHKDQLRDMVIKELQKKNSPLLKQMAEAMVGGFANQETLKYRLTVNVESARH